MSDFLSDNHLLSNKTAQTLYHNYAENMPVFDFYSRADPREIAEDRAFRNIAEVTLSGDHNKWRLMRANGADESLITGKAADYDKFKAFAEVMPKLAGSPVYYLTHLELKRYFDCDRILSPKTAADIWELCNKKLKSGFTARKIIKASNVTAIGTAGDPADALTHHARIKADNFGVDVTPVFCPDNALNADKPDFAEYTEQKLGKAAGVMINTLDDIYAALSERMDFFDTMGCRSADFGLEYMFWKPDEYKAGVAAKKALKCGPLTLSEAESYKTAILAFCGRECHKRNWVMRLRFNARRSVNTAAARKLGADSGFDCVSARDPGDGLIGFFDALSFDGKMPKTIVCSPNPADSTQLAAIAACFPPAQSGAARQFGFNDNRKGIAEQITAIANTGVLGNFVGATTDSRGLLSYTRHEYFRRVLCDLLGKWVENGEYPADIETLGVIVRDVCYNNAAKWFGG